MYAVFFYVLVYVFLNLSFIFLLQCMRLRRDGVFIDSLSVFLWLVYVPSSFGPGQ